MTSTINAGSAGGTRAQRSIRSRATSSVRRTSCTSCRCRSGTGRCVPVAHDSVRRACDGPPATRMFRRERTGMEPSRGRVLDYHSMSWQHLPKPDGVGDITDRPTTASRSSISIPLDEDGFFGRECPSCEAPFKMRSDEYKALPDEIELTCPYCGHREEHSAFMSSAQHARAMAAAEGLVEQWMHGQLNDMLGQHVRTARRARHAGNSFISIDWSYTPGTPPPVRELPDCARRADTARRRVLDLRQPPRRFTAPPRFARCAGRARPARRCSKRSPPRGRRSPSRTVWARTSARRCARPACSSASRSMRSSRP